MGMIQRLQQQAIKIPAARAMDLYGRWPMMHVPPYVLIVSVNK